MNLRFWFLVIQAYILRHKKIILWFMTLSIVLFFLFQRLSPYIFKNEIIYTEGVVGSFEPVDLPDEILNLIGTNLTNLTPQGEATSSAQGNNPPAMASGWEVLESGTVYVFHLRPELKWHDGTRVKSQDLEFNFSDVAVERPDEKTLKFKLKNSFSPFPTIMAKPVFKKNTLIGTGPYKVESLELSREDPLSIITQERLFSKTKLPQTVRTLVLYSPDSKLKRIKFRFYSNEEQALTALKLGEIDALGGTSKTLSNWPSIKSYNKIQTNRQTVLIFNNKDANLGDKNIRQALWFAVSPREFSGQPSYSPIAISSWAYNKNIKQYQFNMIKAREILKKASPSADLKITLHTTFNYQKLAESIKKNWSELGIKTELQLEETLQNLELDGNFQVLLLTQTIPSDPDQYSFWHSKSRNNLSGYTSVRIDKFLEDGRNLREKEKRLPKYLDFQKYLLEDAPVAFLYYPDYNFMVRTKWDNEEIKKMKGLVNID